jgi:hypothetical protein
MFSIWKKEIDEAGNEYWVFIHALESKQDLISDLEYLRQDGFEYRAELKVESTSSILGD